MYYPPIVLSGSSIVSSLVIGAMLNYVSSHPLSIEALAMPELKKSFRGGNVELPRFPHNIILVTCA